MSTLKRIAVSSLVITFIGPIAHDLGFITEASAQSSRRVVGTWDLRWEDLSLVFASPTPMFGYLVVEESDDGLTATLMDQKVPIEIDDDQIVFSYTHALRGEGGGRTGQVTLTFAGEISRDRMQGTLTRTDAIISERALGQGLGMIQHTEGAAPGFMPITLVQAGMVPITFNHLSDEWTATRIDPDAQRDVDLSGFWVPRPEMANDWLANIEDVMTDEAKTLRAIWHPDDEPALRCASSGLILVSGWPLPVDVVQSDRLVVFVHEGHTSVRRVHTDGREMLEDWIPSGMGYSVGEWNDGTLEVTTRWLVARPIGGRGLEHRGEETIVTERFSTTTDGLFLRQEMILEDPLSFTEPLRRIKVWQRDMTEDLIPYECDSYRFFESLHETGADAAYFERPRKY